MSIALVLLFSYYQILSTMHAKILLFLFISLVFVSSYGQTQECMLVTTKTRIQYEKGTAPSKGLKTVTVSVEYWSLADTGNKTQTLKFAVTPGVNTSVYAPAIAIASFQIEGKNITKKHKADTFSIPVTINAITPYQYSTFSITLSAGKADSVIAKTGSVAVEIIEDKVPEKTNTAYDGKPFWIEMGGNIDFVEGPKINNFTAGIFFHKLDHNWGTMGSHRWASFAGAYESKIVTTASSIYDTQKYVSKRSFIPGRSDTMWAFGYGGKPLRTQTIRNWSFFYSPSYRLTNGEYNDGNFHFYLSGWAELRYQEVETKTDFSPLILLDSTKRGMNQLNSLPTFDDTLTRTGVYSHYLGLGFPIYYEQKDVFNLILNPVFGFTNQPTGEDYNLIGLKNGGSKSYPKWNPFYFVQFRLSEKEFGLTVTGEIRGLMVKNSPPQYTIALTKKFNLSRLLHFDNK